MHTLNASPSGAAFSDCLRLITEADSLLLLGDAVYGAINGSRARQALDNSGAAIFVLRDDAILAGVATQLQGATLVDMDGFVELTEKYPRQLAWY